MLEVRIIGCKTSNVTCLSISTLRPIVVLLGELTPSSGCLKNSMVPHFIKLSPLPLYKASSPQTSLKETSPRGGLNEDLRYII